jgi:PAP2 superfamily
MAAHSFRVIIFTVLMSFSAAWADVVTDWNVTALAASDGSAPLPSNRLMATTHAAMFDALNAVTRSHTPYLIQPPAQPDTSKEAAAATAAHAVLMWLYPNQKTLLDNALKTSLDKVSDNAAKEKGMALGKLVAEKYIAVRSTDGVDRKVSYTPLSGPGKWRPASPANPTFAFLVWSEVTPFVLKSPTELNAPGPLPLDSAQYAKEIDEVRRMGSRDSKERSGDQTAAAIFSLIRGSEIWNAAARAAASAQGTSVMENARIFAIMNMAMVDASITGWAIKKQHPLWRPVAAIREATTNADVNWEPLLLTPAHPDYVSGHCITSGAAAHALALLFGNDGVKFSATFGGNNGLTRSFSGFAAAEKEIEDARVWAGIHTRTADVHGGILGHKIADLVVQRAMTPISVKPVVQ